MITHWIDDRSRFIPPLHHQSSRWVGMKAVFAAYALGALGVMSLMAAPARAEMSAEAARASVAPFYKALNAEFAKESPDLVRQATAPEWMSCRGNDLCNSRDEVIAGIGARLAFIPDLKWRSTR